MTHMSHAAKKDRQLRFCTLASRATGAGSDRSSSEGAILLLVERPAALRVLIHPHWAEKVLPQDRDYLSRIRDDFRQRAMTDPDGLFKQASELNVGPLITLKTGFVTDDPASLNEMMKQFLPA